MTHSWRSLLIRRPEGEYTQTSSQQKTPDSTTWCCYVATSIKHLTAQRKLRCHGSTAGASRHSAVVNSCTTGATGKRGNAGTETGMGTGTETGKHGNSLSDRARRCQRVWTTRVQSQGIYRVLERFVWAFICEHVRAIFWTISEQYYIDGYPARQQRPREALPEGLDSSCYSL